MSLSRSSVRRPVAVAMLFLAVILLGVVSLRRLPIDLLPDVSYPQLVVYAEEPGGAPTEVERSITEPTERAVASVPGVQRIESVTREGISLVTIRFAWGTDMDFAALNVRERLDNVRGQLPITVEPPVVLRTDPRSEPILSVSVAGPSDLRALKELADQVFKRRLEQLDGVAHAAVTGGLEREIQVDVDPRLLESYGLTIQEIAQALEAANAAGQGGTIRQGRYRYALRTLGEFRTPEEIGAVVLRLQPEGSGSGGEAGGGAGAASPGGASGAGAVGEGQSSAGRGTGSPASILLRDVARVTDGVRERESIARFSGLGAAAQSAQTGSAADAGITPDAGTTADAGGTAESAGVRGGAEAVGILVFKTAGANTVRVADLVEETLEQLRTEYPAVSLEIAMSQAGFISDAIANVLQALVLGGVLAFLVLFLFLRDARYPVAIATAIPVSVIGSFALLDAVGVSLNIMTLGGLALGVGMLVDNSIVVLENIFRHREQGERPSAAAVLGAEEVQGAITASTLTTISVFGPIVYVEGVAGELFGALSLAVAFSLLVSLLVALTLLPVLASSWEREGRGAGPIRRVAVAPFRVVGRWLARVTARPLAAFDRAFNRFAERYHHLLESALEHRARVVGIAAILLAATLVLGVVLPRSVLPRVDQGGFQARLELERGTPIEATLEAAERLESVFLADPGVEAVFAQVGRPGAFAGVEAQDAGLHTARFEVRLVPGVATEAVVARIRSALAGAAPSGLSASAVELETGGSTALGRLLGGSEADIAVRISADDLDSTLEYAARVQERLGEVSALTNVRVGTELGQPEIRVEIDRERAASYGIDPRQVADAIERSMRGTEATRFADFDRRVPVMVRLPDESRLDLATLDELRVNDVPVRLMVTLQPGLGPAEVHRTEQARIVPVYADVASGGLGSALAATERALTELPPPPGIRLEIGGENEEMRKSFRDLAFAFGLALLLVYMILAAQFESFVHPFIILLSVPLALIGAVGAIAITGAGLNTMSLIGVVILVGIVVNDAIIKVDLINRLRRSGVALRQAIVEAGRARLRPIVMTTITTVLGLTPMALGIGSGADLRAPLAIAVIGGLLVATLLTLIVIPVAYDLIETLQGRLFEATDYTDFTDSPRSVKSVDTTPPPQRQPLA